MKRFIARFAYSGENDGVLMAGLADDQYETRQYLLLQKASAPTKEDVELGQDDVHITLSEESCSAYAGIESIKMFANELRIELYQEAAEALGADRVFTVSFDPELDGLDELSTMLRRMCRSFSDFRAGELKLR
ncbi:Imm10 family immunity protein [Pseudoxanthomonas sp. PXM01]|uniref:Imm10 family immunity protein n=1 Tax=Pseudoxanthomonas sp. PXM01 TaxID=2769295 RepID=UPI00178423DD|nr:Imm10 family immunity protein [Pseudoxanthomonas sp. PXM01]MBD9468384.1 hypothetical protein [Pseudoxanthomonas sp. PXM01]